MITAIPPLASERGEASTESTVRGRVLLPDGTEHDCRVRFGPDDLATVFTSGSPTLSERVVFRLEGVGIMSGHVVAQARSGFEISIEGSGERRRRLQAKLKWLMDNAAGSPERRSEARIVPRRGTVVVKLAEAEPFEAVILDLSPSGASLSMQVVPNIGETILVGRRYADVVRYTGEGVAVRFKLPFALASFDENVDL